METLLEWLSPVLWLAWIQDHPWFALAIGLPVGALVLWRLIKGGVGVRRAVVNVVGIALVLWGTLWFSDWVRPSLTPEDLFDPPVVGPQPVKAAFVERRSIERVATYTGTVHPYERITVYARSNGFVEGVEVYPGDHVRKGQVVAHLETSEIAPRLDHALAELTYLRAELKRDEELFRSGAVAASALDLSRSKQRVAAAKVKLLQTEIGYATITALSDGWVSERMVDPGQYVQRGQPLLAYDRLQKVRLRFDIAEQDLAMVQPGTEVVLEFPQIPRARFDDSSWETRLLADYENPAARAEVTTVFPKLGGRSRLGVVEVLMPNPGLVLRSNTYVVGHLVTGRVEDAWVVPQRALTPMPDGKTVIFLAPAFTDQGEVEMREVVVGLRNGTEVEIVDGLDENAYVVVSGNRGLMDGENVMVIEREGGF